MAIASPEYGAGVLAVCTTLGGCSSPRSSPPSLGVAHCVSCVISLGGAVAEMLRGVSSSRRPPPPPSVNTLSEVCSPPRPDRASTLGAEGSSPWRRTLVSSQSLKPTGVRRGPPIVPVLPSARPPCSLPSLRPPCVALLARPPPPRENIMELILPVTFNVSASNRIPPQDSPDLRCPSRRMGCLRSGSRSGPMTTQPTQREEQ